MTIPTLDDITAKTIATERMTTRVLFSGPEDGHPVLFLHGNNSSATWWEEVMVTLPDGYRGIAPDLRGFGDADPDEVIDATRGMGDLADDAIALLDHLDIDQVHVVGSSMGGSVVWWLLKDYPQRFLTAVLVAPGSLYGFGGTKDLEGTPNYDDFAGSGGGLVGPQAIEPIKSGDRSLDSPFTMRSRLRNFVFMPGRVPEREEELLSSALAVHLGQQGMPGDSVPSPNWPFTAPGEWGANNALSPKYAPDIDELLAAEPKVAVLWIRGSHDLAVSDQAAGDPGTLGAAGVIPGWPGPEVYPPQPMVSQTRAVLEKYAAAGGSYEEVVMKETAHTPYLDDLERFNEHFHAHLR